MTGRPPGPTLSGQPQRPDPPPLRLHRAVSLLSRTGDPGAPDAQAACAETAARIVQLEEALRALLSGAAGAMEQARRVLSHG